VRVLVTGGAGFIGSHAVDRLVAGGHEAHVLDNLSTGRRGNLGTGIPLHVLDLRSPRLGQALAAIRPVAVVHAAAQASVARSVLDPVHDANVNVLGTIALLEASRRAGVERVVYISTGGAAYGDTDVLPTPEDHPLRPASPYGVSKLAAERWLDCWATSSGAHTLTLRLANVYGPRQDPAGEAGVVAIFAARLLAGAPCVVNGDGEQTRDYVYVEDVADAIVRAVTTPGVSGTLNISTGLETSVNELYARLARRAGVTLAPQHGPARPGEQRRSVLDAARAGTRLGWTPVTPLQQGLEKTLDWFTKETGR